MKAVNPPCKTLPAWLRENLGPGCLGVLTGTDAWALAAAVQIVELYSSVRDPAVLVAFRVVVEEMQPCARELAFHCIAHVMDWDDRFSVWEDAGLPALTQMRICKHGPEARR